MRKLLMLASVLAFALLVAAPALAQDAEEDPPICHATGSDTNPYTLILPGDAGYDNHLGQQGHEGDFALPGATSKEDCEAADDGEDVDVDEDVDEDVDGGDDADDGDDIVNENNNTNVNVNTNTQAQAQSQSVVVNLTNFNQNFVFIGGTKVFDLNKDGVITIVECKHQDVTKTAAVTFATKVVTADTVVTSDVVTSDVVTSDVTTAVLPETGGSSLLALGAGALLVAGGLLARRIVR